MKGDDRNRFSKFATLLSMLLHRQSMKLSITVHAKEEVLGTWDGVKAHDYKALGAVADRFNVMTYDFSWSTSEAGPIAPTAWVERVISFAKTQVEPSKIGVGIACYGYDWSKKPATSLDFKDFKSLAATVDPESGELVEGKLHFSGSEAFRRKYELATRLGVGSVAFWYCGSEDPKIWDFLPKR
jgi:spore germination protein